MLFLELFYSFFKIGLFSFGGGYAMIPLMFSEIALHGWLSEVEFVQIIGIAEMTPGPIAVNAATFVGFKTVGVFGSVVATLGVATPSLLISLFISPFLFKNSNRKLMKKVFYGIRPVVAGLILYAAINIGRTTLFVGHSFSFEAIKYETLMIALIVLVVALKSKIHPIMLVVGAGLLGLLTVFI